MACLLGKIFRPENCIFVKHPRLGLR